jgi:hypothetical protein
MNNELSVELVACITAAPHQAAQVLARNTFIFASRTPLCLTQLVVWTAYGRQNLWFTINTKALRYTASHS